MAANGQPAVMPLPKIYGAVAVSAPASWVLVVPQMFLMLPPAPMKRAAEASATNAMSRVYLSLIHI